LWLSYSRSVKERLTRVLVILLQSGEYIERNNRRAVASLLTELRFKRIGILGVRFGKKEAS